MSHDFLERRDAKQGLLLSFTVANAGRSLLVCPLEPGPILAEMAMKLGVAPGEDLD
jgi:hypothetical protein